MLSGDNISHRNITNIFFVIFAHTVCASYMRHKNKYASEGYYGLFNDSFPPIMDGVTLTVENYARLLEKRGMTPCVVTPSNPAKTETTYDVLRYFSLPIYGRYPYRYGYPKLDFNIWRELRRRPFRLVHSHCPFSSGRLALYTARQQHIPLIGTFHSKYRTDMEHSMRHMPWLVDKTMKKIVSFFEACDEVWIPQAHVEETVREYGYRGKLTVMENGNDFASECELTSQLKQDARNRLNIPDDTIALLFVGQHIWEKGIRIIADALHQLKGQLKFKMNFIGNGYALEDLKELIADYGLQDCVEIHGMIQDRDSLRDFYAGSDLFLFPSFYDNAPLVVREAAAMGTPSVLPIGSTASEVINAGVNGFLAERTPEAYAAIIRNLASRRHDLAAAGINARATIARSWDDVIDEVADRYAHIIKNYK